jgi:glycosyltransferase involved in cell wall biosynthesis
MPESAKPRLLLLSAYDAGSHRRWRQQLCASQPAFEWDVLALPPRFFRWRIRGNPLTWLNEPALAKPCDLLIATSMVDLASLKSFHPHLARTPCLLYMHENQFAYPVSARQHSSAEPRMVNLYSAIAADRVLFNSAWNQESFLDGARAFLDRMPDGLPDGLISGLRDKSGVLPVPIEDRLFTPSGRQLDTACPHLLWNHRWEYDKAPDRLLLLLDVLKRMGQDFRLSVVGERFRQAPDAFDRIRECHGDRIVSWGYLAERASYDRLLAQADVVISTALHDFQGLSVLEAMASGCLALAPDRLAYPEYVPGAQRYASYPDNPQAEAESAAQTLLQLLQEPPNSEPPAAWRLSELQGRYQGEIRALLSQDRTSTDQISTSGVGADDKSHQGEW